MIFVTGPLFAGKQECILEMLGWTEQDFLEKGIRDAEEMAASAGSLKELEEIADRLARKEVVIATEVGAGIIPADPAERRAREAAGTLSRLLAARADTVVRVCCGIPQIIKGKQA